MGFKPSGGDTSGSDARAGETRRRAAAQEEIANVEDIFSAFNPDYWAQQTADLQARYDPQVETAYSRAKGSVLRDLATKGQGKGSSVYQQKLGRLEEEDRVVRENLAANIMSSIAGAEGDVLSRKQNLINTISAASDPSGAGMGAAELAQSLRTPVQSGFDVSGAFRDYQEMANIGDLLRGMDEKPGGVRSFGKSNVAGRVIQ